MVSRRNVLSGLAAAATTGCAAPQAPRQSSLAPESPQTPPAQYPLAQYPVAPPPPSRATQGLDAVIDISAHTTVSDFRLVRASNILAVIHKASEGDFYADCCGAPIISARAIRPARSRQRSSWTLPGPSQGPSLPWTSRPMKAIPRTP